MQILSRGVDFDVWGDPRVADWVPAEIVFDQGAHGTKAGAVLHELARRSGLIVRTMKEASRRCELVLGDASTGAEAARLTVVVVEDEQPEGDVEGVIAYALAQNHTSWPAATKGRPERHIGYGAYHSLATAVAEQLRRSGIRFVKAPPARQHSV